ncbi:MAG: family lipase [Parcubacteria group bacterium]|nr:family lipase [Parcubacteria group bacterium]
MLKNAFYVGGAVLIVIFAYYGIRFYASLHRSKVLIQNTTPFTLDSGAGLSMLVIGDSTAVGVGASKPEDSLPGRVSELLHATRVENYAVSGAMVQDLPPQIAKAKQLSYDFILVQIGANDITHRHSATTAAQKLVTILKTLPSAKQVLVISAGDVGSATIFPPFLAPYFTQLTLQYHTALERELSAAGITYVNLYKSPDNYLFSTEPETYLAADGFHPSSAGYGLWSKAIAPHITVH